MLLVKSEAAAKGFVSVNLATTRFANGAPTTGVIVCGEGRMLLGSSPTVALIGTGTSPSRTDVNDAAYVPGNRYVCVPEIAQSAELQPISRHDSAACTLDVAP